MHLALELVGVQAGDAVLCPTLTFVASASPIVWRGAEPVFVDSEREIRGSGGVFAAPVECQERTRRDDRQSCESEKKGDHEESFQPAHGRMVRHRQPGICLG